MLINNVIKGYGGTVRYWDKAWKDRAYYWVDEDGVLYEGGAGSKLLTSPWWDEDEISKNLLPGHKIDKRCGFICKCGCYAFRVDHGGYETGVMCLNCGFKEVIHSG